MIHEKGLFCCDLNKENWLSQNIKARFISPFLYLEFPFALSLSAGLVFYPTPRKYPLW